MSTSYPGGIDSYDSSTFLNGETIEGAQVTNLWDSAIAIETALGTNLSAVITKAAGGTINGTLNASVFSGTTISGGSIYRGASEINSLYTKLAGDTMAGTLKGPVFSGTTISGNTGNFTGNLQGATVLASVFSGTTISGNTVNIKTTFIAPASVPASSTAAGAVGQISVGTDGYLYFATGINFWVKLSGISF